MGQRYKVFINEKLVQLSTAQHSGIKNIELTPGFEASEFLKKIASGDINESVNLICNDLEECWSYFKSFFKEIFAAGGAVFNDNGQMLWIHRLQKWDLPKGKIDEGEDEQTAAVREVIEECGVEELELREKLLNTYHVYQLKGDSILKTTAWYHMQLKREEHLTPQLEEDITEVGFFDAKAWPELLTNSYLTIAEVINALDDITP